MQTTTLQQIETLTSEVALAATLYDARAILNRYQRIDSALVIKAMRAAGCDDLIHYAGAAHRDRVAWHLCAAWLAQPADPEHVLKSRAIKVAWGWSVAPEAFLPR